MTDREAVSSDRGVPAGQGQHSTDEHCTCQPMGDDRCDYRWLADRVIELFNPPDDEAAEASICLDALTTAQRYIAEQPCRCPVDVAPPDYAPPCSRCQALGRRADKAENW